MKIITRLKQKVSPLECALLILLFIQFSLIAFSNFTMLDKQIDCDSAKLMTHIIKMWEEKTLFIPDWAYVSTLEWDCTAVFAIIFYGITGDIFAACALSNILLMGFLIAAVFLLFRGKELIYPLLSANLICIPYRMGMLDYYNMLFFGGAQYIVKVMIPILLIGIILIIEQEEKLSWIYIGGYIILLIICSVSSGVYIITNALFPIILIYLGYKFIRWEKISRNMLLFIGGSFVLSIAGVIVNAVKVGGSRGSGMVLNSAYGISENVRACFYGLFEVLGGLMVYEETKIFSYAGIVQLSKLLLTVLMIFCGGVALVRCIKRHVDLRLLLLLGLFIMDFMMLCAAKTRGSQPTYEYRYHLPAMIPLFCITVIVIWEWLCTLQAAQKRIMLTGGILALLFMNVVAFRDIFSAEEQNKELRQVCRYFEKNPERVIYLFEAISDSEICRILDTGNEYICLHGTGITAVSDYYMKYYETPMELEGTVIVTDGDFGEELVIAETYPFERTINIGEKYLYYYRG